MRDYILTQPDIDFYNKNGYLIVDNLYTEKFVKKFLSAIRRHANNDFAAILNPDRITELKGFDERPKSDLTLEEIRETSELCQKVIAHKAIIQILRTLQQGDIVCLSSQVIFKEASSPYSSQAWSPHQDNRYIDNENAQYITVNWFLRDSTPENGGIYVYPGSHKLPILPAPHKKSFREDPSDNPGRECEIPTEFKDKKKDVITKAGAVVFLHGNCIHGSYANDSNRSRPFFATCYITKGEYYNVGKNTNRKEIDFE